MSATAESGSDDTTSNGENGENEQQLWECRHCPGLTFTEAEKDTHRSQHRRGSRRGRSQSPSSVISFHPVGQDPPGRVAKGKGGGKRKSAIEIQAEKAKKERREKAKVVSNKRYDRKQKKERVSSG